MAQPTTTLDNTLDEFRTNSNIVSANVGDPAALTTTDKSSAVAAINELKSTAATSGDVLALAIALG
jgi:hypothetical protein